MLPLHDWDIKMLPYVRAPVRDGWACVSGVTHMRFGTKTCIFLVLPLIHKPTFTYFARDLILLLLLFSVFS